MVDARARQSDDGRQDGKEGTGCTREQKRRKEGLIEEGREEGKESKIRD